MTKILPVMGENPFRSIEAMRIDRTDVIPHFDDACKRV